MRLGDACQTCWLVLIALQFSSVSSIPTHSMVSDVDISDLTLHNPRQSDVGDSSSKLVLPRASEYMSRLGFGWIYGITRYDSFLPVRTAATTLGNFYRDTIYNAEHVWPTIAPPISEVRITQGAITLQISCKRRAIPWSMVKSIAEDFLQGVEEGITGRFEGRFVWALTGVTIWVNLRVNALMTV